MPAPQQETVQPTIEKYCQPILNTVRGAWEDWLNSPHRGLWPFKRSRANFVWAQMIVRARQEFHQFRGIRIVQAHETFNFIADDKVLFRFKKGDESGRSANIPTPLSLAFYNHDQILPGLPDIHRVQIVYILNGLETKLHDVLVVARDGKAILWSYSLLSAAVPANILPLPPSPSPGHSPAVSTRHLVRPRRASQSPNPSKQK